MTTAASRRVLSDYVVPAATLVGVLVVWEIATHALRIPRFVMPPPSAILAAESASWENLSMRLACLRSIQFVGS